MWLTTTLIIAVIQHYGLANQNCPEYLSKDCNCIGSSLDSFECDFIAGSQLKIINSSYSQNTAVNLTILKLSVSNLSSLPTDFFNGIYSIKTLDLSNNTFESMPFVSHPKVAATIKTLNISYNRVEHIDDSTFSVMSYIEIINISNNKLREIKDNTFVNNPYLWCLDLSNNNVESLSTATFNGIENSIHDLDVSKNNISHIDRNTFTFLHDLKYLKISGNHMNGRVANFDLPSHLILLDLSNSQLTEMDVCRLLELTDLEYVNLVGNPLICSCHLNWLLQRLKRNQIMDDIHPVHGENNNGWTCQKQDGTTFNVTGLHLECNDHSFLTIPDHCKKEAFTSSNTGDELERWKNKLKIDTEKNDEAVLVKWNNYNYTNFYGYDITIYKQSGEKIYTSPKLHPTVSEYTAKSEELASGKYQVCLNVFQNETHTIGQVCKEISFLDLQIVVGILAGVIFLIPCVVALTYIMCLDKRKFLSYDQYGKITEKTNEKDAEKQIAKSDTKQPKKAAAKWKKTQTKKDTLKIPSIKVQDYTLTSTHSSENILKVDHGHNIPNVRSTDRILPEDDVSIEPDGDSGSSAGIRIDIPSDHEEPGVTNKGYAEEISKISDIRL